MHHQPCKEQWGHLSSWHEKHSDHGKRKHCCLCCCRHLHWSCWVSVWLPHWHYSGWRWTQPESPLPLPPFHTKYPFLNFLCIGFGFGFGLGGAITPTPRQEWTENKVAIWFDLESKNGVNDIWKFKRKLCLFPFSCLPWLFRCHQICQKTWTTKSYLLKQNKFLSNQY